MGTLEGLFTLCLSIEIEEDHFVEHEKQQKGFLVNILYSIETFPEFQCAELLSEIYFVLHKTIRDAQKTDGINEYISLIDMVYKYILMKMFDSAFECYESNYLQSMPSSWR